MKLSHDTILKFSEALYDWSDARADVLDFHSKMFILKLMDDLCDLEGIINDERFNTLPNS